MKNILLSSFGASERIARRARSRWLPEGRRGPMPWIIAIILFLTILSAAAALALGHALSQMRGELAGGYTIQLVEADAAKRDAQVEALKALLAKDAHVDHFNIVPRAQLRKQLEPWIGGALAQDELPIPALIDVTVKQGTAQQQIATMTTAIRQVAPSARVDAHQSYLAPVEETMRVMMWLAVALVVLMMFVTGAVVTLAMRSAHETHRPTIDIMHLLGATDIQVARLFQRRMAFDALFGGAVALIAALPLLWLLGNRISAAQSELLGMMTVPVFYWGIIVMIPLAGVLYAVLVARITVQRTLERSL